MKKNLLVITILLSTSVLFAETREGVATDLKSGQFLYKEVHQIEKDKEGFNKVITSSYLDKNNNIFAKMVSDFSKNKMIPETTFEDFRFKLKQIQKISSNEKELELIHLKDQKQISSKKINLSKDFIAGQGFDNYIKANFSKLENSKIKFVVLDQLDFFSFRTDSLPSKEESHQKFQMKMDSFFISLLVAPITVTYDKISKSLIQYEGLSNIFNDKEKSQEVLIAYKESTN